MALLRRSKMGSVEEEDEEEEEPWTRYVSVWSRNRAAREGVIGAGAGGVEVDAGSAAAVEVEAIGS